MEMHPIKKQMSGSNAFFPFSLVFEDTKEPESELPNHLHDWHEIVYIYGGKGVFFIDDYFHNMDEGNLFLIPSNTIHRALPDSTNPVTSTAVFFGTNLLTTESFGDRMSLRGILEELRRKKVYKLVLTSEQQETTRYRLVHLRQELGEERFCYRQVVTMELQLLLLEIIRVAYERVSTFRYVSDLVVSPWITRALVYIEARLSQCIYLSELAELSNMSESYFSKAFKQMTGLNLTEYITTKRIVRARELLEKTDDIIAYVAESCGFSSIPHFHRTFLKYTGMTPAAYRKSNRQANRHTMDGRFY